MPSSLFGELGGGGLVEDQSAFRLALELSMLSLGEPMPTTNPLASPIGFAPPPDDRAKKSQNMTECVPVPSSEHVAEIVGRQGTVCLRLGATGAARPRHPYIRAHVSCRLAQSKLVKAKQKIHQQVATLSQYRELHSVKELCRGSLPFKVTRW
ncbi:RNA-binding protein MEX3B [Papilio machaon]|uniref:RNA-binding protein MEX3B n=1 Tax=Papilio machaon TaxID=76193 RepID=A0A194R9D9_PAPMA|nr:RNA-binding protein MEX3B [Papilio machaon]